MPAVGRNKDAIRSYIRQQEKKDARLDQLNLWCRHHLQVVPKSGPRQRPRTAASSGSSRNAPALPGDTYYQVMPLDNPYNRDRVSVVDLSRAACAPSFVRPLG